MRLRSYLEHFAGRAAEVTPRKWADPAGAVQVMTIHQAKGAAVDGSDNLKYESLETTQHLKRTAYLYVRQSSHPDISAWRSSGAAFRAWKERSSDAIHKRPHLTRACSNLVPESKMGIHTACYDG